MRQPGTKGNMPKVLIGSGALHYWRPLSRPMADTDILMPASEWTGVVPTHFRARDGYTEYSLCSPSSPYVSDQLVYDYCMVNPVYQDGLVIAPMEVLKVLKLSCYRHLNKPKHELDLRLMEDVQLDEDLQQLVKLREREVRIRTEVVRDRFFNKYTVPRVVPHDSLHLVVADVPAYQQLLIDPVVPDERRFMELPLNIKLHVVWEELMVLVLERWALPAIHKYPAVSTYVYNTLLDHNMKQYVHWRHRLGTDLKDHPDWLKDWIAHNDTTTGFDAWSKIVCARTQLRALLLPPV